MDRRANLGSAAAWATAAAAVLAGAAAAGPAHASAVHPQLTLLQCQGTETDSYSPGVVFTPRLFTDTITGRLGSCLDGAGLVTSGSYGPETAAIDAGCDDLLDGFQSDRTLDWSTGDSSVFSGTGQSTEVAGQVITTITGTITSGRFAGHGAVQTITLPQPGVLQCLTTGYTGATGITTLTVT